MYVIPFSSSVSCPRSRSILQPDQSNHRGLLPGKQRFARMGCWLQPVVHYHVKCHLPGISSHLIPTGLEVRRVHQKGITHSVSAAHWHTSLQAPAPASVSAPTDNATTTCCMLTHAQYQKVSTLCSQCLPFAWYAGCSQRTSFTHWCQSSQLSWLPHAFASSSNQPASMSF